MEGDYVMLYARDGREPGEKSRFCKEDGVRITPHWRFNCKVGA